MSLTQVKEYFSAQLNSLGLREWEDAFGEDNLPSTAIDRSYHQRVASIIGTGINQETIEYLIIHEIKLYFKAFQDTDGGVDAALTESENVVVKCLNLPDYTGAGLKGVLLDSIDISPFDIVGNDNVIVSTIQFNVRLFACLYN